MPLVDRWLARIGDAQLLRGVTVLNIQHQFGNQVVQTRALLELGVSPSAIYWIEIPYTSSAPVREALYGLGVPPANVLVSDFRLLDVYASYQRERVARFLEGLLDDPPERLVVLDDGSYMLEALAAQARRLPSIAIVEQTTRGLIKIEDDPSLQ